MEPTHPPCTQCDAHDRLETRLEEIQLQNIKQHGIMHAKLNGVSTSISLFMRIIYAMSAIFVIVVSFLWGAQEAIEDSLQDELRENRNHIEENRSRLIRIDEGMKYIIRALQGEPSHPPKEYTNDKR